MYRYRLQFHKVFKDSFIDDNMKIVFTPDWFLGTDVMIELFSFIILFLFFVFSYKSYKITKNKKSLYLGLGFLLIAIAEAATILTKVVLYYDMSFTRHIGEMVLTYNVVKSVDFFYELGFFLHKFFTLLGLYFIYRLPMREKSSSDALLIVFFILISSLVSTTVYYLFHVTSLILLSLIFIEYYGVYRKNKSKNTKMFLIAIGLLAFSSILFIMSSLAAVYVGGQFIQLIAYIVLLVLIIGILNSSKEIKKH